MQTTANSSAGIEAQIYSRFIIENLQDGMLPEGLYRNVTDFASGTTINIPVLGTVVLQDLAEDQAVKYSAIDSGTVTLTISEYPGHAWYVTDDFREDGYITDAFLAQHSVEAARKIQEHFETEFLKSLNDAQTDAAANNINGFPHRIASGETNDVVSLEHFVQMKLAFDKAGVPTQGRVAIVDPVCEATLNQLLGTDTAIAYNPNFEGIINTGMASSMKFVRNIMGFDVMVSNRLDTGSFGDGTNSVTGVANVFMCVVDDMHKPGMAAWRRMPKVETERNKDFRRDEFTLHARYGVGVQRLDTLGILITSATAYE